MRDRRAAVRPRVLACAAEQRGHRQTGPTGGEEPNVHRAIASHQSRGCHEGQTEREHREAGMLPRVCVRIASQPRDERTQARNRAYREDDPLDGEREKRSATPRTENARQRVIPIRSDSLICMNQRTSRTGALPDLQPESVARLR